MNKNIFLISADSALGRLLHHHLSAAASVTRHVRVHETFDSGHEADLVVVVLEPIDLHLLDLLQLRFRHPALPIVTVGSEINREAWATLMDAGISAHYHPEDLPLQQITRVALAFAR